MTILQNGNKVKQNFLCGQKIFQNRKGEFSLHILYKKSWVKNWTMKGE